MSLLPSRQLSWWSKLLQLFLQLILFVFIAAVVGMLLSLLGDLVLPATWLIDELPGLLWGWSITLISVLTAVFVLDRAQSQWGLAGLGFVADGFGTGIGTGLFVGGSIIIICFLILYLGGWASILAIDFHVSLFLGWLLFFLIQPLAEEVVMRSFLQNQLHRYFGAWPGLLVSALIFGLLHLGNNGFTWIAGLEIVLGGLLMGQLYLYCQNIWAPFAMHAIWNFLQSTVLGFAVSGMDTYRVFRLHLSGPTWLTGGDFGLEGSVLSLFFILVAIRYFWGAAQKDSPWDKVARENWQKNLPHESDSV